jgi:F-type H+-transporting ATPase subunit b
MKTEAEANLARTLERREQQALERISQSEAQALAQVRSTAVDVALSAAEALIRENLDDGKKKSLTDQAIGELQRRFN